MARKNGLPENRHREIGLALARMRDTLTELAAEIQNAYPKGSRPHQLAIRAMNPIDHLRAEMESRYYDEHLGVDQGAYYPSPELRRGNSSDHEPRIVAHLPFHDHDLWCCPAHAEEAGA